MSTSEFRSLWLWGSRIAYVGEFRRVVVCDLRTGERRVIRVVDRSTKYVGGVRADGDVVVWEEFENPQDIGDPSTGSPWEIHVHDLQTNTTSIVATGVPRDGFFTIPEPQVERRTVVWLDLPPGDPQEQGPVLVAFDLRTKTRRVLAAGNFPYSHRITGGEVFFSAKTDRGRDLHVVAADGSSPPHRLTQEGGVDELDARNGWVTWARFSTDPDPNRTIGDEPIVVLKIGSNTTRVIAQGQRPVTGDGFAIFDSVDSADPVLIARTDGTHQRPLIVEGGFDGGLSIDGHRVVWATVDNPHKERKPAFIRIGRVLD